MRTRELTTFTLFAAGTALLVLLIFAALRAMAIETGAFLDWVIGIASFWWLMAIVTIPWNVVFRAREVLDHAETSRERGIAVAAHRVTYVRRVGRGMLAVALTLHGLSALGFYLGARFDLVSVGYVCSGLALGLTLLRPSWRGLEYIQRRLASIDHEVHYPREDVITLRYQLDEALYRLETIERELDPHVATSFRAHTKERLSHDEAELRALHTKLNATRAEEATARAELERAQQRAIQKLSEDSQFLGNVRELIRFVRDA